MTAGCCVRLGQSDPLAYAEAFVSNYRREFGFELQNRSILIDDVRVRAVGRSLSLLNMQSKKQNQLDE